MAEHNDLGKWGEQLAEEYLYKHGYIICERNWRSRHRELDMIALTPDASTMVFIEVKTRTSIDVMRPEDAVNRAKIRNIGLAANAYIKQNNVVKETRFDVITVIKIANQEPVIEHIEDAFNPMLVY